ncbi:MAG: mannose-6-phosphate isomerase, partial [Bacteroidota bacterium]|nr:mannose-6-phosphate isomerase [Bacteroidota bacterium]
LDKEKDNFAWCFDCVPEENSLKFFIDNEEFETPSINLVLTQSTQLLGKAVEARFGKEFPIRFDFLDTMDGGNLSFQVHPNTKYIQKKFGLHYTQDESYYLLDAKEDATVYLGLQNSVKPEEMIYALREANNGGPEFPAEEFVNIWPAKKHDHFLIPAGTIHCSGKNSMVLEISSTPYIFTFKMWDWNRLGIDGKPRPINIDHAEKVINWNRRTEFTRNELVNQAEQIAEGDGWREERTGLHNLEFIETRRHWFTKTVTHQTEGSVNVLNLIEGREAIITSPSEKFKPFIVHYAETFIIPEAVKEYCITPFGESKGKEIATIKARVRI